MIRRALLASVLLAAPCSAASAQAVTPGIYSSVTMSEETGDLLGAEFELIGTGADARVEFVVCEGWCNEIHRAPVRSTPDGLAFAYVRNYVNLDGSVSSERFEVLVGRTSAGVTVTLTPASTPDRFHGYVLQPVDTRFGLQVAASEN